LKTQASLTYLIPDGKKTMPKNVKELNIWWLKYFFMINKYFWGGCIPELCIGKQPSMQAALGCPSNSLCSFPFTMLNPWDVWRCYDRQWVKWSAHVAFYKFFFAKENFSSNKSPPNKWFVKTKVYLFWNCTEETML